MSSSSSSSSKAEESYEKRVEELGAQCDAVQAVLVQLNETGSQLMVPGSSGGLVLNPRLVKILNSQSQSQHEHSGPEHESEPLTELRRLINEENLDKEQVEEKILEAQQMAEGMDLVKASLTLGTPLEENFN